MYFYFKLKYQTYALKTQINSNDRRLRDFRGSTGLIGSSGLGLGCKMGHWQLRAAVPSQSLSLSVEPHEAATEMACPFPPMTNR